MTWIAKHKVDLSAATPVDTETSDIPSTPFNSIIGQSEVRTNYVLRLDQPQATLLPGASPKSEGHVEWLLAVPTRMYRWANKNHMTSFIQSCWQVWKIPNWHLTLVCCQDIVQHGNQTSFHLTCWSTAQLKRIKIVRILSISSIALSEALLWPFPEKEMQWQNESLPEYLKPKCFFAVQPLSETFFPIRGLQSF